MLIPQNTQLIYTGTHNIENGIDNNKVYQFTTPTGEKIQCSGWNELVNKDFITTKSFNITPHPLGRDYYILED